MDIANVVFVCGRQIRCGDPLLEVANATVLYSNTDEGVFFSFLQVLVLTPPPLDLACADFAVLARSPNRYTAGSETEAGARKLPGLVQISSVFIPTEVVFLSGASWFCQWPGSSHIWRVIWFVTGLTEQVKRKSMFNLLILNIQLSAYSINSR